MLPAPGGIDPKLGRYVSKNLAGVMVPVNADIPDIDVAPAIVNAVYHATGKRVRDLPIRIDRLLDDS